MVNTRATPALLLLSLFLWPDAAAAQRFGQWSWNGRVGVRESTVENRIGDSPAREFVEQEVELSLGLKGFLGHPAIGRFDLGLDMVLADFEGGRVLESDDIGARLNLQILPRGRYPLRLFFNRRRYDFALEPGTRDVFLGTLPELATQWGVKFGLRHGWLRGLRLGAESTTYEMQGDADDQGYDRQYVEWARSGRSLQQKLSLEHRDRSYGVVGLELDDLVANIEERFVSEGRWSWMLNGIAVVRDVTAAGVTRGSEDLRLRSRLSYELRERDRLDLQAALGTIRPEVGTDLRDYGFSVFYRYRLRKQWELAPFAQFTRQKAGDLIFTSPRTGLAVTWNKSREAWEALFTVQVSSGRLERTEKEPVLGVAAPASAFTSWFTLDGPGRLAAPSESWEGGGDSWWIPKPLPELPEPPGAERDFVRTRSGDGVSNTLTSEDKQTAYGLTGSLIRGRAEGWQQRLEFEVASNDVNGRREPLLDLPSLGAAVEGLGSSDNYRGRLAVERRRGQKMVGAWGQWERRESTGSLRIGDFTAETYSASVQLGRRWASLLANVGTTEVMRAELPAETLEFAGAVLDLRPLRRLNLRASYRTDVRRFLITPDIDGSSFHLRVGYEIGAISIEGRYFRTEQQIEGIAPRTNQGVRWNITRRLGGWLPIVTGGERRGVIR